LYIYQSDQGRIQDFKLGGAHLKKLRRAEGGAKIVGVFRVKNHDFTQKKSYFFQILGGGAPGAPPPGSAPGDVSDLANQCKDVPTGQRVMAMAFNATFNTFRNIVAVNFIGGGNPGKTTDLPSSR
jgi:hypothetical protein